MTQLLGTPVVVAIGWALLHLLWQGAIISAIAALLLRLFRESSANVRYLIACAALAMMVAMPILTATYVYEPSLAVAQPLRIGAPSDLIFGTASGSDSATSILSWRGINEVFVRPLVPWFVALWLLGVAALSLRLAVGWARLQRICRLAAGANEQLVETVRALSERMHLTRPIRVAASRDFDVPVVVGWLRPVLLFPMTVLSGLTPQQIETIAAHELAHIRRHDYIVNLLQTVVETLLFYHPGVWWLSTRIRAERENCCDDVVVATCGNAVVYARALTELEGLRSAARDYAVAATGGSLRQRVVRLVCATQARRSSHRLVTGAAIGITLIALLVVTPLSLLARQRKNAAPTPAGTAITVTPEGARVEPALAPVGSFAERVVAGILFDEEVVPVPAVAPVPPTPAVPSVKPLVAPVAMAYAFKTADFDFDFDVDIDDVDVDVDVDDVDEKTFKEDGKLSIDELVHLRATGVTSAYVEELRKAGYDDLPLSAISQMAVHGVDAEFIAKMNAAGFGRLSVGQLIAARIHDLDPDAIRSLRQQFGDLPFQEMLKMQIHGIDAEYIAAMEKLFGKLDIDRVVALAIHGVDAEYVAELSRAGYSNLTADQARSMAVMGVDADYIKSVRDAGFAELSVNDLVKMKAMGVDAEYIRDLEKLKKK